MPASAEFIVHMRNEARSLLQSAQNARILAEGLELELDSLCDDDTGPTRPPLQALKKAAAYFRREQAWWTQYAWEGFEAVATLQGHTQ